MTLISIYIRTLKYSNSRIRDERMTSLAYGYATVRYRYSSIAWVFGCGDHTYGFKKTF